MKCFMYMLVLIQKLKTASYSIFFLWRRSITVHITWFCDKNEKLCETLINIVYLYVYVLLQFMM